MSARTHHPRRGLYVGLALTLSTSLALQGAGLWLALAAATRASAGRMALAIIAASLTSLIGGLLVLGSVLRERAPGSGRDERPARRGLAAREALGPEEAAALAHAQKMEALGLLAGGVAHDFNNLLHVIRNALEILQRQGLPADSRRYLEMIRRSADRAVTLTRQLLAFSRRQPPEPRPLDPNELIRQVSELLRHSLGERITIETSLPRGVWNVAADAGQLETALLNLAINARDAMSQAGLLTIETANAALDEPASRESGARGAHAARPFVMISVSDTGAGMAPEVAARACEPFFTTKEPGHGTGLGLSQVAGFAQQSGGHVRIVTAPGRGTTVRLYLPKCGPVTIMPAAVPAAEAGAKLSTQASAARAARRWWPAPGC